MYYLATDKVDVFHYGEQGVNQKTTTGQPFLEFFETEQELESRLLELNQEYETKH